VLAEVGEVLIGILILVEEAEGVVVGRADGFV